MHGERFLHTSTGGNNGIISADGSAAGLTRVTPDGTWTYARSGSDPAWTTTLTDPQGNQTVLNFQGNLRDRTPGLSRLDERDSARHRLHVLQRRGVPVQQHGNHSTHNADRGENCLGKWADFPDGRDLQHVWAPNRGGRGRLRKRVTGQLGAQDLGPRRDAARSSTIR